MALDETGRGCGQVVIGAREPGGHLTLRGSDGGDGVIYASRLFIDEATGRIGIGTWTPRSDVDLRGNIYIGTGTGLLRTTAGQLANTLPAAGITVPAITATGTADTTYSSNEVTLLNALKQDVTNLRNALNALLTRLNT